jgi:hypothetical protein
MSPEHSQSMVARAPDGGKYAVEGIKADLRHYIPVLRNKNQVSKSGKTPFYSASLRIG